MADFTPTDQQKSIIDHEGSAFISACPGAGKTRCIVARAEKCLANLNDHRGLAFLSFTNAAVSELESRLVSGGLLLNPPMPHFLGTFDSFLWHFLVSPFECSEDGKPLKLVPDTGEIMVFPFPNKKGQGLPLNCFDRKTGVLDAEKASKHGFSRDPKRHQSVALSLRLALLKQGIVDFDDARDIANANLQDADFSARLAAVLSSRFKEVIVDEAQDCNPDDLTIITWLRDVAIIPTKVVCDPNQSIYGFRGGVSSELFDFSDTFADEDKLPLTGNFRSTDQICKVVHALRAPSIRGDCDTALGELANNQVAVHIISYAGKGVSPEIGKTFAQLAAKNSIQIDACRVVAKTRNSGINAVGGFVDDGKNHLCLRIARAAKNFQHATLVEHQLKAVIEAHKISLELSGFLADRSYHQVLEENGLDDLDWRGQIIATLKRLHFDVADGNTRQEWVARARAEYLPHLQDTGRTISQKIQNKSELDAILQANPIPKLSPSTIHEVKGKQFIGVCVVLTTRKTKAILAHLTDEPDQVAAEDCREFYVAASRARQFLAIACPKSQLSKLTDHLELFGSIVEVVSI